MLVVIRVTFKGVSKSIMSCTYPTERRRALNRDAFFAFQIHRIHLSPDSVLATNIMDCINFSSVEENTLCQCRLSTVNMCTYTDVSKNLILVCAEPSRDAAQRCYTNFFTKSRKGKRRTCRVSKYRGHGCWLDSEQFY